MTVLDFPQDGTAPIGYFVHHQGRGHAERCAALLHALPATRPVTVFCARPDILPVLPSQVTVQPIPSLFERQGGERDLDHVPAPETVHCAPVGWPGIRQAMAIVVDWFRTADPALIVCDVSAEVAQLARLCSVPHVVVLQHGDRTDPGHQAAFDGAAGLLAPFDAALAQPDWTRSMIDRTCFAGGLGVGEAPPARGDARQRLGIAAEREIVLVVSGGGGAGLHAAPLAVGARARPEASWITIGHVDRDWHATEPSNLHHMGWVDNPMDHIAAADIVVASTGNTTCQQILACGRPWIAVPEWRYFDEQVRKAEALCQAGAALHLPGLPASAGAWRTALDRVRDSHDPGRQTAMVRPDAAAHAARWFEDLAHAMRPPAAAAHPIPLAGE